MRIWIVTLMLALGGSQVTPPKNGVIEGRVIRASNGAPVIGARVVLVPPPAPRPPAPAGPASPLLHLACLCPIRRQMSRSGV
jgi:hypothetical protein